MKVKYSVLSGDTLRTGVVDGKDLLDVVNAIVNIDPTRPALITEIEIF